MAKMTLLEMTQNILSAMDSDDVNSITDTVESLQVATVIKETYYEIIDNLNIPSFESLLQIDPSGSTAYPNYLKLPDEILSIKWLKYDYYTNSVSDYHDVEYLAPEDFLLMMAAKAGQDNTEEVIDFGGAKLWVTNNENPHFWTTFDNKYIVCDSYDSSLDSNLQHTKTMAWGQRYPSFTLEDAFIPELDVNMFSRLLAESKSVCFFNFKQMTNPKEEQKSRRQKVQEMNNRWRMGQRRYDSAVNYGRRHRP